MGYQKTKKRQKKIIWINNVLYLTDTVYIKYINNWHAFLPLAICRFCFLQNKIYFVKNILIAKHINLIFYIIYIFYYIYIYIYIYVWLNRIDSLFLPISSLMHSSLYMSHLNSRRCHICSPPFPEDGSRQSQKYLAKIRWLPDIYMHMHTCVHIYVCLRVCMSLCVFYYIGYNHLPH